MKENYNTVIKTKDFKVDYKFTLTLQFISMILIILSILYYIFIDENMIFIYIPSFFTLLLGSYNTKKYLKKEKKSYLYLFGAILVLISLIGELL